MWYQRLLCRLGRQIKASIQADRRQWSEMSGTDIETLLASNPPLVKEAWTRMKGWYQEAKDRAPPPAWIAIKSIAAGWVALYQSVPPPPPPGGEGGIPVLVEHFVVDKSVPEEAKI